MTTAADHARRRSKRDALLDLLRDGEWHTTIECARVGGLRFGGRIGELRALGYDIETRGASDDSFAYRLWAEESPAKERRCRITASQNDTCLLAAGIVTDDVRREAERAARRCA